MRPRTHAPMRPHAHALCTHAPMHLRTHAPSHLCSHTLRVLTTARRTGSSPHLHPYPHPNPNLMAPMTANSHAHLESRALHQLNQLGARARKAGCLNIAD
ncbi:hypothetical protein BDZ97DRAFT_1775693 [Flammula alnicola]|nr:hypothetical protein BDZ97DRAFT_1775693 [Flammula alnicola]